MSAREFVGTNILISAFDRTAGEKRPLAATLIERLWEEHAGCVSIQVLQEFYVTATRKLAMPSADAAHQVERLGRWVVHRPAFEDVLSAIELHQLRRISFWDAMVLTSALKLGCPVLWSEDLSGGQHWGPLVVRNPFTPVRRTPR